ncbi:hypothetical protein HAZT_HAZT001141 [Hyalella azteca]|uniref:Uncharacterized protein n=1 Tax=Hyalella azteca TaxID=294128 RepID=A0A6A0GWA3_HYAAZ|nr:hypothetical protein HAZT_HAZT001141 [Hyalella azteca]
MEEDYGFSDFKIKRTPSVTEKKVTSTRRPSTASSYARNAGGTSSVTGTLSRSVARVIKRRKHVVLLGLDGSGKTTILMRLKYDAKLDTTPTVGFNHEKIRAGGFRWSAWDVGGGERVRSLWATYTRGTDGVVFVVDASANADTMEEARLELARIMKVQLLAKAIAIEMGRTPPPLLVMANFQDRKQARSAPAIAKCLSLPVEGQAPPSGAVPVSCWAVACVCAVTGDGLDEAFATLRHLIDNGATQPAKRKKIPGEWWR